MHKEFSMPLILLPPRVLGFRMFRNVQAPHNGQGKSPGLKDLQSPTSKKERISGAPWLVTTPMTSGHQVISASNWSRAAAYTNISVGNTCSEGVSSTKTKLELELSSCSCYAAHAFVLRLILMILALWPTFPLSPASWTCWRRGSLVAWIPSVLWYSCLGGGMSHGNPRHVMLALAWHDVTICYTKRP